MIKLNRYVLSEPFRLSLLYLYLTSIVLSLGFYLILRGAFDSNIYVFISKRFFFFIFFLFQYVGIHFHYILNAVIKEQFTLHSLFLARNSRLDTGSVKILLLGLKEYFFSFATFNKSNSFLVWNKWQFDFAEC